MNILLWVLQVVVGLLYGSGGYAKAFAFVAYGRFAVEPITCAGLRRRTR